MTRLNGTHKEQSSFEILNKGLRPTKIFDWHEGSSIEKGNYSITKEICD